MKEAGAETEKDKVTPRSIYRETLFLNMTASSSFLEVGMSLAIANLPDQTTIVIYAVWFRYYTG